MRSLPFLTEYDPPGSSEGSLDPLGLYLIADQLAMKLVPSIRERMQRIRFLTPMAVGALVTEGLEANPNHPETPPFLVWEWLVIEAIIRIFSDEPDLWGIPGRAVTKTALTNYNYIDHRNYLKTPRVFGFHGVYKRLAVHIGVVDSHICLREPKGLKLIQSWSKDHNLGEFGQKHELYVLWRKAVEASLKKNPVRTAPGLHKKQWKRLAELFMPDRMKRHEKSCLKRFLITNENSNRGAIYDIWMECDEMDKEIEADKINEKITHQALAKKVPRHAVILDAIGSYEYFCRLLTDAFNIIRNMASQNNVQGFNISTASRHKGFSLVASKVHDAFVQAYRKIEEVGLDMDIRFKERFKRFSESLPADIFAKELCEHHEWIQRCKSKEGKRPWFDRVGAEMIYMRQNYRLIESPELSELYIHEYRTKPIYRFYRDLT